MQYLNSTVPHPPLAHVTGGFKEAPWRMIHDTFEEIESEKQAHVRSHIHHQYRTDSKVHVANCAEHCPMQTHARPFN